MKPRVSIIVPTVNEAEKTIKCFTSIALYTKVPFELVWVDNGSKSEHFKEIKSSLAKLKLNTRLVKFDQNVGFVQGTNAGIRAASPHSQFIILLNNDTEVTPEWVNRLVAPFTDKTVGAVGPVTQSKIAWQEAINLNQRWNLGLPGFSQPSVRNKVPEAIKQYAKSLSNFSNRYVESHGIPLSFFCVALSRDVINNVGLLDEEFGFGLGDDDEYCARLRSKGYKLLVSLGTFVYHWHRTTFKALRLPVDKLRRTNVALLKKKKVAHDQARP